MNENPPYKIVRSKNYKRLTFSVSPKGFIRISAPYHLSLKKIQSYLAEYEHKLQWDRNSLQMRVHMDDIRENKMIEYPFLDDQLLIKSEFVSAKNGSFSMLNSHLLIRIPFERISEKKEIWMHYARKYYRQCARQFFEQKAVEYAQLLNKDYKKIRIGDQSSRWGSCSTRKTLSFNFRLLLAPGYVAEYVALHEVAHLVEPNHSHRFWTIIKTHCPEYKSAKHWLNVNGKDLWTYF